MISTKTPPLPPKGIPLNAPDEVGARFEALLEQLFVDLFNSEKDFTKIHHVDKELNKTLIASKPISKLRGLRNVRNLQLKAFTEIVKYFMMKAKLLV